MRRGQSSVEAVLAAVLLAILLSGAVTTAARHWHAARTAVDGIAAEAGARRAQGVVEVVALAPLVAACVAAFALACAQLTAQGRAEAALAVVQAADAAGASPPAGLRVIRADDRIMVAVRGPFGDATAAARPLRP